jgi:hypothetical protein
MEDSKAQFNSIALGIISHLESLSDVSGINFNCLPGVSSHGGYKSGISLT